MFQNAARKANQSEIIAEKKRAEAPVESRGISKQKWFEEKQKRLGKQLELNGLNTSKAFMLDTQEQAETKYKKWEKKPAPFGWDGKSRSSNLHDFMKFAYMISLLNQSNACRNRSSAKIPTERLNRPITDLVHALIGDSVIGSWIATTILEWFKQKQEISDSGRFLPRANCKDEANRMREAEKIIERYVANPITIQVMDETRLYFRVLSMSKEDTCYNVYFQASFCDCLDYACKCKHLMCITLFIEQHMPDSRKELHLIDDALEMRDQDANANLRVDMMSLYLQLFLLLRKQ